MVNFYYKHYIRIDDQRCITHGFSTAFEEPVEGDICISNRGGYQFRLIDGGEENPPLHTVDGIPLYRWDGSQVIPRTEAEIQADREALPPAPSSQQEKTHLLEQQVQALTDQNSFLEECIAEMAGVVYA